MTVYARADAMAVWRTARNLCKEKSTKIESAKKKSAKENGVEDNRWKKIKRRLGL